MESNVGTWTLLSDTRTEMNVSSEGRGGGEEEEVEVEEVGGKEEEEEELVGVEGGVRIELER